MKNVRVLSGLGVLAVMFVLSSCQERTTGKTKNTNQPKEEQIVPDRIYITIKSMKFVPAATVANVGDTAYFVNDDIVVHDVTEELNKDWTSSKMQIGDTFVMVIESNTYYYCSIHPNMKGKILVR